MTRKDGGPAFPLQQIAPDVPNGYDGMSLRDWFAGQALAAIIQCQHAATWTPEHIAGQAYSHADAMIAEMVKK